MARRISLPPADELFGNGKKPAAKPPKTTARRSSAKPKPATKKPARASSAKRRTPSPEARLSAIESRLDTLPVDALIDLRDGISELLAGDAVDERAVLRLLDSVEA